MVEVSLWRRLSPSYGTLQRSWAPDIFEHAQFSLNAIQLRLKHGVLLFRSTEYYSCKRRYVPLPDLVLHAPLVPDYPAGMRLEEDVMLGCHEGPVWLRPDLKECRIMCAGRSIKQFWTLRVLGHCSAFLKRCSTWTSSRGVAHSTCRPM